VLVKDEKRLFGSLEYLDSCFQRLNPKCAAVESPRLTPLVLVTPRGRAVPLWSFHCQSDSSNSKPARL